MQTDPSTFTVLVCDSEGKHTVEVSCRDKIYEFAQRTIGGYIESHAVFGNLPPPEENPQSAEVCEKPWTWPTFTEEDEEGSRDRNKWMMCLSALVDEEGLLKNLRENPTIKCFVGTVVLYAYLYENNVGERVPIDIERIPRDFFEKLERRYS